MRLHHIGLILLFAAGSGHAALHDRGDGFIYDDVLDVTWAQNMDINGADNWANQMAWVAGYSQTHSVYGTFSDWRLPITIDTGAPGCDFAYTGTDCGYNVDTATSEMASLFYDTLGLPPYYDANGDNNPAWLNQPFDFAPFINFGTNRYLSSTEYAPDTSYVWGFMWHLGGQNTIHKLNQFSVLAVRDGDIAAAPPPIAADIEVQPEAPFTALHPQHDGSLGPQQIAAFPDDPIGVVVFTQSTAAGDPVDLDATDIDPTTLAFGPGGGAINPASTPDFSQDVDSDGLNDAQFEFLTSDSGIQCPDVDASLSGELLTSGDSFLGTDAITTDCAAQCHN